LQHGLPKTLTRIEPARLRQMVDDLAGAIARGECTPRQSELIAIVEILSEAGLHIEARRVLLWMAK
jgi:hypothetical protein